MARYKCPSCGAPYNGKICRECLYEHFTEEIAHGNHTHEGEPLVITAPVRRPVKRKDPFGCEKRTRKKHPLAGFVVLLAIINSLLPMLRNWGLELEAEKAPSYAIAPEPEPEPLPENLVTLHEEGSIHIFTTQQDLENFAGSFTLYVQNDSNQEVNVLSPTLLVNGFVMQNSALQCQAQANSIGKGWLYLDEDDLQYAQIGQIKTVDFVLDVCGEGYATLFSTDLIHLGNTSFEELPLPELGGTTLYLQDGLEIRYLRYVSDSLHPDNVEDGTFLFFLENTTDQTLNVFGTDVRVGGENAEIYFYTELPPGSRAVTQAWLYDIEGPAIHGLSQVGELDLYVDIREEDNYDDVISAGPLQVIPVETLD